MPDGALPPLQHPGPAPLQAQVSTLPPQVPTAASGWRPSAQGYKRCVLTPNLSELGRLAQAVKVPLPPGGVGEHWQEAAQAICAALQGPVLVSVWGVGFRVSAQLYGV